MLSSPVAGAGSCPGRARRHPGPGHQHPGPMRTDQARILTMHCRFPTSQMTRSVKDDRNEKEDHRHNMHESAIRPGGALHV
jgi:hypothetical protein